MKICHLIFSFTTGGAENMLIDIVNEQIKIADISLIIVNNNYNLSLLSKIDNHVKVYLINRKPGSKNPIPLVKLNILLLKINPHFVHCHNHNLINVLLPSFRKISMLTIHSTGNPINNLSRYKKVFSISKSVANDIYTRGKIESIIVYNGIDIYKIKKRINYHKNDKFKIIQIGRFDTKKKGQHLAIEAIRILKNLYNIYNLKIDFIGEGSSEEYLKELVDKYNLQNEIKFLGLKDREYIYNNLCNYELLIQPSLNEGFGLTVVEAMAAKVPVLVSNIDGPMEIIEGGKYGYFFESGNSEQLAQQINYIYSNYNSHELQQKIELAFDHVKINFDITMTAKNYIKNYK